MPEVFTRNAKVCVTFDSLCGTAFMLRNTPCEITRELLAANFWKMARHCVQIQETFIKTIREEYARSASAGDGYARSASVCDGQVRDHGTESSPAAV